MTRHRKRLHPDTFSQETSNNVSQPTSQSTNSQGGSRVENGGLRQMAPEWMYSGETSFQRQTLGRDRSQQYASQARSGDQSQGNVGDEVKLSDHDNDEESEDEDNFDGKRWSRRRRGPN